MSNIEGLFRAGIWHELTYENKEENADKFWSIKVHKNTHIRHSGRTGATPRETITEFDTQEEAREDAERLFNAQINQGYRVSKPQLAMTTELVHTVSAAEFNRFVYQVYDIIFDFLSDQNEGLGVNGIRFYVDGQDIDREYMDRWRNGEDMGGFMALLILDDCVRQRLIPAGDYLIEVDSSRSIT